MIDFLIHQTLIERQNILAEKEKSELYNKAELMFDNNNYYNSLNILKKIQRICENNNYSIDITHLIKMMKDMIRIQDKKNEEKEVVYSDTWELETAVTGDFTITVTNDCPSALDSNKDRMTILKFEWL